MNGFLVASGALAIAIALAHSWLGERYILIRLFRREDLPYLLGSDVFTKRTLRLAWHLTTVAWLGFGALLLGVAASSDITAGARSAVSVVGWTFLASAAVALIGSRGRHLSWLVFLAIAGTAWLGSR